MGSAQCENSEETRSKSELCLVLVSKFDWSSIYLLKLQPQQEEYCCSFIVVGLDQIAIRRLRFTLIKKFLMNHVCLIVKLYLLLCQ